MNNQGTSGKVISAGVFSAIAASLCCITPVVALIAGTSGIASSFSWIEPAKPYLIGVSIAVLGFAWYQKLKPEPIDDCGCEINKKSKFIQSKTFLSIVTCFAIAMIAFPSYSHIFFPDNQKQITVTNPSNIQTAEFKISGMTCNGCEEEVKHEVNRLEGIIKVDVSYQKINAVVQFDNTKTNLREIEKAINSTGYAVIQSKIKN